MMNRKFEWWVGVFTVTGLFALLFLALKVSNFQISNNADTYTVYAYFDEIGGLKKKAPVTMSGVLIGRVSNIDLDLQTLQAVVTVNINGKYNRIPDDTSVSILTAGILGEKYLGVTPGGSEEYLTNESVIEQTQSAIVLENLVSKFLLNNSDENNE